MIRTRHLSSGMLSLRQSKREKGRVIEESDKRTLDETLNLPQEISMDKRPGRRLG